MRKLHIWGAPGNGCERMPVPHIFTKTFERYVYQDVSLGREGESCSNYTKTIPAPEGLAVFNSSKRCPRGATCDDGACGLVLVSLVDLCMQ